MFKSIVPLSKEAHAQVKIKPIDSYTFVNNIHLASIMVHEFYRASAYYPIVFIEDKDNDSFKPVAMLGLEAGKNLFVDDEGKWTVSYIPAIIRRYPFALAKTGEEGQFTVCIDDQSDLVNSDEGRPLFNEDGSPGEMIENIKRYLGELQQMDMLTTEFCSLFKEKNMFTPLNMRVREADSIRNITGAYVINEQRLNALSDESFMDLRKKNLISPIYSHLCSLNQIERLLKFKENN